MIIIYKSINKNNMKLLALLGLVALATAEECPHDLEVRCIDDINKAYPICEKAAQEKGKDFPADLECMKYFAKTDQDCWPCICLVAETAKWNIKGCGKWFLWFIWLLLTIFQKFNPMPPWENLLLSQSSFFFVKLDSFILKPLLP